MTTKNFVVFDADSHVVEPPTLWDKYLDAEYRTLAKHALWRQEGRTGAYLKVNGEIFRDTGNPNLPRHALWRPGMDWDAIGALDPDVKHPAIEGASDPPHKTRISCGPELGTFCLSRPLPARIGQGPARDMHRCARRHPRASDNGGRARRPLREGTASLRFVGHAGNCSVGCRY